MYKLQPNVHKSEIINNIKIIKKKVKNNLWYTFLNVISRGLRDNISFLHPLLCSSRNIIKKDNEIFHKLPLFNMNTVRVIIFP